MKINKLHEGSNTKGCAEKIPALYFSSRGNARYNAISRDLLGDPDYIEIYYENQTIVIKPSTDAADYKITRCRYQRFFSALGLMAVAGKIPDGTKLYGFHNDGSLSFSWESIENGKTG